MVRTGRTVRLMPEVALSGLHPKPLGAESEASDRTSALCVRIRAGDAAAIDGFYREWSGRVIAGARSWTGRDEAFCLDVMQDVMLRVIAGLPRLENERALEAWMSRVTRSCAADRLKGEKRRLGRERRAAKRPESRAGTPTSAVEDQDEAARIEEALGRLDAMDAAMVRGRAADGRELAEIAAEHGVTTGSAWGRVRRALAGLRRTMTGGAG